MAIKIPHIGELRFIGYFENNDFKIPYTAGYVDGYASVIQTVNCKLWQSSSRRVSEFGTIEIISYWNMICRFQSAIDQRIKINSKFVVGQDRYTITGITVLNERNFWYHFTLNLVDA